MVSRAVPCLVADQVLTAVDIAVGFGAQLSDYVAVANFEETPPVRIAADDSAPVQPARTGLAGC